MWENTIYDSGLWIAADQGSWRSNVSTYVPNAISGFEFVPTETGNAGIFVLTRDSLDFQVLNWPVELSAPADINGDPKMYGDIMAWAAYQSPTIPDARNTAIQGVRVGVAVYLFNEELLSNAIFVRYDIMNTSSELLSNVHVGYHADTDLAWSDAPYSGACVGADHGYNQTGYDLDNHTSYTYLSPNPEDGAIPNYCYGAVVGYSILEMSSPDGLGASKMAHRNIRKHKGGQYAEFAEEDIRTSEHMMFALEGLSPSGDPMVDPTTGNPTKFAFTGDPITGSGWIDDRYDVRSLQSISPFDLAPGDEKTVTVAWIHVKGQDLESGLNLFRAQFDYIMSRRDAWDF